MMQPCRINIAAKMPIIIPPSEFVSAMTTPLTSLAHPLQIAEIPAPQDGVIGVTFCPGKQQPHALTGHWARDLNLDLQTLQIWGAGIVVTLVEKRELYELAVPHLGDAVRALGMQWFHLPIPDGSIPDAHWERGWPEVAAVIHDLLNRDGRVIVHCKGGLGRAGTLAAKLLIERGRSVADAIREVRTARPGAIENIVQERYLRCIRE